MNSKTSRATGSPVATTNHGRASIRLPAGHGGISALVSLPGSDSA